MQMGADGWKHQDSRPKQKTSMQKHLLEIAKRIASAGRKKQLTRYPILFSSLATVLLMLLTWDSAASIYAGSKPALFQLTVVYKNEATPSIAEIRTRSSFIDFANQRVRGCWI